MDREAWPAAIYGVAKSWTQVTDWTELNVSQQLWPDTDTNTDVQSKENSQGLANKTQWYEMSVADAWQE